MPTTTAYDRGAVVLLPFPFSDPLIFEPDLAPLNSALRLWFGL